MPFLLILVLALLVGDGAGGLAGRLAGGLALAAAALDGGFLEVRAVDRLDMFHRILPPIIDLH